MNKLFAVLISFFMIVQPVLAVAPLGVSGYSDTTNQFPSVVKVPNKQATNLGSGKTLIESGNSNLLQNPSFEHSTYSTGWTQSGGSSIEETTVVAHGKKAMVFVASGTVSIYQDSAINVGGFFYGGVQGLAYIRINTSVQGLYVCPRKAGSSITSNYASQCYTVKGTGNWELAKIPFTLGATSNGIEIKSTASVSGNIYLDDAFVGAVDLKADGAGVAVQSNYVTSASSVAAGSNLAGASSSTDGVTSLYSYNSSTGVYTANQKIYVTISHAIQTSASASVMSSITVNGSSVSQSSLPASMGVGWWQAGTWEGPVLSGQTFVVSITNGTSGSHRVQVTAKSFTNSSTYSSTNADTDWASCGHTTSSFTGFGTVSAIETQCKRQGGDLLMKGKFTSGTSTATEARISLPVWNGSQLTSKGTGVIPSIQIAGKSNSGGPSSATFFSGITSLIEPSVTYMTFGLETSSTAGLTKQNASGFSASGTVIALDARIPIEGWDNSNIIIGQFNGLESCADSYACTDVYSAYVAADGTVSQENLDWISGNCTVVAPTTTCTFKNSLFTVAPNCQITGAGATEVRTNGAVTTTTLPIQGYTSAGANASGPYYVSCQKQGADYIGKTAKAVASDQNLRTPGVTKGVRFSAKVGGASYTTVCSASPCTAYDNRGSIIGAVTRSGVGQYSVALSGLTGTSPTCSVSVTAFTSGFSASCLPQGVTTSSITVACSMNSAAQDMAFQISCDGETP